MTGTILSKAMSFLLMSILTLCMVALAGCKDATSKPPLELMVGFDTSASFRLHLPSSAKLIVHSVSRLNAGTDRIVLFRLDNDCEQFFDGPSPISSDELAPVLVKQLKPEPDRDGTYPAAFFQSAASQTNSTSMSTVICYMSDGDIDGHLDTQIPQLRQAAAQLAKNNNVKAVCLIGVSPSNWARWRSIFAPLDGRLIMMPASAMNNSFLDQALQDAGR